MLVRDALKEGQARLLQSRVPSASIAAEWLLMHALACDRASLHARASAEIPAGALEGYFHSVAERARGKPTQYITGHQEFWGLDFEVTPDVLIPRPETERLVERVLELAAREKSGGQGAQRIVDVGTGSGCIAIALASELQQAEITAADISPAALAVARRNAKRLGFEPRIDFFESDLVEAVLVREPAARFDFVVSNPPYVGRDEWGALQREVRDYEPRIAWGGVERGDEFYGRIFPQALRVLDPGGYAVVEIGYNLRDRVLALLGAPWDEIEVRDDYAGIPRVVSAKKRL